MKSLINSLNIIKAMFTEFTSNRVEKASWPLLDVISKINLFIFANRPPADPKKDVDKLGPV